MSVAVLFSGQGAQHVGMGKSLYENHPIARKIWDDASEVLGYELKDLAFNGPDEDLTQTKFCQPALYVHGYAIYNILKEQGKLDNLRCALGLSLGELTAHAVAGTYSFATGLQVVAKRGALMQEACEQTQGAMASIIGGEIPAIQKLCDQYDVDIANLNCPGQTVISGEKSKIDAAVQGAAEFGFKRVIPLKVAGAYHSRLMKGAAEKFQVFLDEIEFLEPKLEVFTNVTGSSVSEPASIKAALVAQVYSSVRWENCMYNAAALGISQFYECGPGNVLKGLAKRTNPDWLVHSVTEQADLDVVLA